MADNTFDDLASRYQNFTVPAVKVMLGENNLAEDLNARIEKVKVTLCLQDESSAEIVVWDCYDLEKHAIVPKLKAALTPGSGIQVYLGYQSSYSKVFDGYLDTAELMMSEEGYALRLIGYDVIHLMKANRHVRIFRKNQHSAIFRDVMESYAWLCLAQADDTAAMADGEVRMQEWDDYRFVTEHLAGEENPDREFYVQTGTAYFSGIQKSPSDIISLKPQQGVREMTASWSFLNRSIQVQGCDGEHTVYTASEDAKAATLDDSAGADCDFRYVPCLDSEEKVKAWAAAEAKRLVGGTKKASANLVGLPELLAGGYMSLEEFDSLADGQYRITKAVHTFDEDGYRTEVELGAG